MEKVIDVVWTKRSSFDLRKIFDFNSELKDVEKAAKIVDFIIDTVERSLINKLDVGAKIAFPNEEILKSIATAKSEFKSILSK